ncbi:MAG: M23 family metallopeptidase [Corallococcus sp.]|nr:M23 family metallopeptidase [Corallococcus sp.]
MNSTKQTNKFTRFLRNHAALLLLVFCILAIATVVLAVTLTRDTAPIVPDSPVVVDPTPDDPTDPTPIVKEKVKVYFSAPLSYTSVSMDYTDGTDVLFVFNSTINDWEAHKGIDLVAADGTDVCSMYDGTVVSVADNFWLGQVVTIDHGDNVVATYASLSDVQVTQGQTVKKGDKIGAVSTSASKEFKDGAHLHLEVAKNGKSVDPVPYVSGEIFREVEQD